MQVLGTQQVQGWAPTRIGFLVLAIWWSVLAGCATSGKVNPAPGTAEPQMAAESLPEKGPLVRRLDDGREGFIITETPRMDAESRSAFARAVVMLNEGDYDQAIDVLGKVIERSPDATAPLINIALAYARIGQPEQAEEHLRAALNLVPDHPVAGNEYGLLLRKAGRFAEAREIYEKTLSAFPEYSPVRRNLGILCDLYLNDLQCALEQYTVYREAVPEDEQVKIWIADLRLRLGN